MSHPPFPLIRHFSAPATALLLRLPISANQVTTMSMAAGLYACWLLTAGTWQADLIAAGFFFVC